MSIRWNLTLSLLEMPDDGRVGVEADGRALTVVAPEASGE